jgi:hypothetical protein
MVLLSGLLAEPGAGCAFGNSFETAKVVLTGIGGSVAIIGQIVRIGRNVRGFRRFFLNLTNLCGTYQADVARRAEGTKAPSNLLHSFFALDTPVFVKGALVNRKMDFTLDVEEAAEKHFFGGAKALYHVTAGAGFLQRVRSFWGAP